jgi:hypothetical protein
MSFMRLASVLTDLFHSTAISYALSPWLPRAVLLLFFSFGTRLRSGGDLGFGFMGVAAMELAEKAKRVV